MTSPIFYIVVSMAFTSLTLAIIFFIVWKTFGEKPYALSWSIGFLAATCQWFVRIFSHWFPNDESLWLTTNAFALILITLVIRGHCQRTGCRILPQNLWPYTIAIYAAIVWTTVVAPHAGIRAAIVPTVAAIMLLFSARIIIRHREKTRPAEWAAATSIVLFAITQGIAGGMALMQGPAGNETYQSLYVHFNFLTLPAGFMAMGMFVILMLASDLSEEMKSIAVHDQLTGALNRHGLGEQGATAYATSRRTGVAVSVIMTDIDRFKAINDKHGHSVGDDALVHFSNLLSETRRVDDIIARFGGEEFAMILPGTELRSAMKIAADLCKKIEASPMQFDGGELTMTASFGVAGISDRDNCIADTITRADSALYRSKRAGRNQVDLESSQLMLAEDGTLKPVSA